MNRRLLTIAILVAMVALAVLAGWLPVKFASGQTASRTMTVDPYGDGLTSIGQALALIPANPTGVYTIRLWTGSHNPGNILKPNTVVTGVDKGAVIMVVNGGQTGFRMAQGSRISDITIIANADANGDAVAIDANDKSFTIEDVDIRMTRTANRAFGIYEPYGLSPAIIELRRLTVTDDRSNHGRAIKVSDGNVWNKVVDVRNSRLATGTTSATVEVDAWGSSRLNFYDSLVLGGGVNSTTGGEAYSTTFGNFVWSGRAGSYLSLYQSYMEKLKNGSAGILSARNSHARTIENTSDAASTWWWSGTVNVIDSTTYPGPPLGSIVLRRHDRLYEVIAKMGIQDAIDMAALVDQPAPSANTPYAVLVSPDRYVGDLTMRTGVNVVGTSAGSTFIVGTVTPAVGASLENVTVTP